MNAEAKKTVSKQAKEALDTEEFDKAKQSAREAYAKFQEAREHLKSAAVAAGVDLKEGANEFVEDKVDTINSKGHELFDETEEYVRKHPLKSAGIAFFSGFVVSKILRL